MYGVTSEDVLVMRKKINQINGTLNKAVAAFDATAPAYYECRMMLEELLEAKELWQEQLHLHASTHLLQVGGATGVRETASAATPPATQLAAPPPPAAASSSSSASAAASSSSSASAAAAAASSAEGHAIDGGDAGGAGDGEGAGAVQGAGQSGGGVTSGVIESGLVQSDIDVYMLKIEAISKRIKILRPKFNQAYAKHAPSELALEEAREMKTSLCSQLLHILTYNENHKTHVVREFICASNLEHSFGEDQPREDLPV
jgi:hypothetical protein